MSREPHYEYIRVNTEQANSMWRLSVGDTFKGGNNLVVEIKDTRKVILEKQIKLFDSIPTVAVEVKIIRGRIIFNPLINKSILLYALPDDPSRFFLRYTDLLGRDVDIDVKPSEKTQARLDNAIEEKEGKLE